MGEVLRAVVAGVNIRLALYAAAALLVAYLVWQNERLTKKANAANQRAWVAERTLDTERAARLHEQKIAKEASDGFQRTVTNLQDELAARPLKPVVIRVRDNASVPATASAGAATGSDAGTEGRIDGEAEIDIAAELTAYSLDCQRNTAQLDALQSWVRSR